ncbi:sigma-70 family RNA polymerase sigma factor [Planctomycetota bacterium]|nr:sigma-70 family RNA polymerase sigma factor [Planctomycetota bacterium]
MVKTKLEKHFRRYAERLWRLATIMLSDRDEAFDAVQQAFLVVSRKSDQIPEDNPWPWLRKILINEIRNTRRKHKPTPVAVHDSSRVDARSDPYQSMAKKESLNVLQCALADLPDAEFEAIELTSLQGLTHQKAADALGVPVKTVSSRVSRGIERLRQKLSGLQDTLLASVASVPAIAPPGGFDSAVISWKVSAVVGAGNTGSATGALVGGSILSKSTTTAVAVIMATLIGFGGGVLLSPSLISEDSEGNAPRPVVSDNESSEGTLSNSAAKLPAADASESMPLPIPTRPEPSSGTEEMLVRLQKKLKVANTERTKLIETVENLEDELRPHREEVAAKRPVFTFGKHGKLDGVVDADWRNLGRATHEVTRNLRLLRKAQLEGNQAPRAVMLAVQKNTEKMRTYEYGVLGKLTSWAKHNGELTHPISHANLIASELKLVNMPLSENQVDEIEALGLEYERKFDVAQETYSVDTPRVRKLLDEYGFKGQFVDSVWELLTIDQRDFFIDEQWHHVAFVDLYCPTLMIIHTSPIVVESSKDGLIGKLKNMLVEAYGIAEEDIAALDPILETWASDVESILDPVMKGSARFYTYAQSLVAAEATVRMLSSIDDFIPLTEESRKKMLDSYALYIPRVVKDS